jgi:site-specific recombinase XerD
MPLNRRAAGSSLVSAALIHGNAIRLSQPDLSLPSIHDTPRDASDSAVDRTPEEGLSRRFRFLPSDHGLRTADTRGPLMIRRDKQNIPVLRVGIERFIEREETAGKKDVRNTRSLLLGAATRVVGKTAAGPAFAQTEFGNVRMDRLQAHDFTRMFGLRVPEQMMAPATRKRAMSDMSRLIQYGIQQEWLSEHVAGAIIKNMPDSPPANEWLYPEQVDAISTLLDASNDFDDYLCFAHDLSLALGTRTFETVSLKRSALDPRSKRVTVIGKGRGAGKKRWITVDDAFAARWDAFAARHGITRDGFMLYQRKFLVTGGSEHNLELRVDKAQPTTEKALRTLYTNMQTSCDERLSLDLQPSFKLTPKVMRRTFACTQLILHALGLGGLDLRSLQMALGHESLETTQVYLADVHAYLDLIERPVNTRDGARLILLHRKSEPRQDTARL